MLGCLRKAKASHTFRLLDTFSYQNQHQAEQIRPYKVNEKTVKITKSLRINLTTDNISVGCLTCWYFVRNKKRKGPK